MALVKSAIAKASAGKRSAISPKEQKAWDRWEAEQDEQRGMRFLAAVPKKKYCEWSGRQVKVLHDQADAFGAPLRGATIDLREVVRWMHDFFAAHKHQLPSIIAGEAVTPREQLILEQTEVYKRRVVLLEHKIEEANRNLLPRAEVHELHAQLAKVLRGAGERLHKQFGPQAASILDATLDDYDATIAPLEPAPPEGPKSDQRAADSGDAAPADD